MTAPGVSGAWDALVAAALLGTDRRPVALPADALAALPGPLREVLARLPPGPPERAVLAAAAVLGPYRQAGRRPSAAPAHEPAPAPPEHRDRCRPAAAERLERLLAWGPAALLREWLEVAGAGGWRVPEERLPALLDLGRARPAARDVLAPVLGARGAWLAARNPDWEWAAGGDDPVEVWRTGSPEARRLALTRLRATDPRRGLDLLASTWPTEAGEDRVAFAALLEAGLSGADEPFLEAALDDRRGEVRRAAAALLAALPGSRLAARMAERARALVRVEGRARRRPRLVARSPAGVDRAMARDGVEAKPPAGMGERSWWLLQVVAATPLGVWTEGSGLAPADLARLAAGADEAPALLGGWARAAARQRHPAWAEALLPVAGDAAVLVGALPPARVEDLARARLAAGGLTAAAPLLARLPAPWSPELSRVVLAALVEARRPRGSAALDPAREIGLKAHPAVAAEAARILAPPPDSYRDPVLAQVADTLAFRHDLHEELRRP